MSSSAHPPVTRPSRLPVTRSPHLRRPPRRRRRWRPDQSTGRGVSHLQPDPLLRRPTRRRVSRPATATAPPIGLSCSDDGPTNLRGSDPNAGTSTSNHHGFHMEILCCKPRFSCPGTGVVVATRRTSRGSHGWWAHGGRQAGAGGCCDYRRGDSSCGLQLAGEDQANRTNNRGIVVGPPT